MTITERLPVAFIRVGGQETAVSADGYLLAGADFDAKALPRIEGAAAHGVRLDEDAAAQAAILGATPGPLKNRITASTWDDQRGGVVVDLKNGPEVRFGDGSRAQDKWEAAVAVLSGDERGSPSYLDVSVPGPSRFGRLSALEGALDATCNEPCTPNFGASEGLRPPDAGRPEGRSGNASFAGIFWGLNQPWTSTSTVDSPHGNSQARLETAGLREAGNRVPCS